MGAWPRIHRGWRVTHVRTGTEFVARSASRRRII